MPLGLIPQELRDQNCWLRWKLEERRGTLTKVPYHASGFGTARTNDSATWCSFQEASTSTFGDGLGLVIRDDLVAIDLDKIRDAGTGVIEPWAQAVIDDCDSYTELSPSKTGVHIWVRSRVPKGGNRRGRIEMYDKDSPRYMTVTGEPLVDKPIRAVDLANLHHRMLNGLDPMEAAKAQSNEVDNSAEDFKFCCQLAREGKTAAEIDQAMRSSNLMRAKWDERRGAKTYGAITIAQAIGSVSDFILRAKDGSARAVVQNVLFALRNEPEWQGILGFDELAQQTMLLEAPPWDSPECNYPAAWCDHHDVHALCWMQRAGIMITSINQVAAAVETVAHENRFHPVRNFLRGLVWDGIERCPFWLVACMGAPDTEFVRAVSVCWLISAIARVMQPGIQCDYTLLLEGAQGIGKSSALRALTGDEYFSDHMSVLGSRDSRQELCGKWIIELSELSALRKSEIESIKAFLSERIDHYRVSYGRRAESFRRQCVFCATTNSQSPLIDETGNRRFWPVRCTAINVEAVRANRDQLWAEAFARYMRGEKWWFDTPALNELATAAQEERYEPGPRDEAIEAWALKPFLHKEAFAEDPRFPWNGSKPGKVNIQDLLVHGLGIPLSQIKQSDQKETARCLRHLGWQLRREGTGRYRGVRYYISPAPLGVCDGDL
jgi:Virulence-associated protein E